MEKTILNYLVEIVEESFIDGFKKFGYSIYQILLSKLEDECEEEQE